MNPVKEFLPWEGWDGQISVFGFIRFSSETNCVTDPISVALSGQVLFHPEKRGARIAADNRA